MKRIIRLTESVYCLKSSSSPLSSDSYIIEENGQNYIFDCGSIDYICDILNEIENKCLVVSHFHPDHIGNISKISFKEIYLSNNTFKYVMDGKVVDNPLYLTENIEILPIPSSHAKGCLSMRYKNDILFTGDALGPKIQSNCFLYNQGNLKELIEFLKNIDVRYIIESHSDGKLIEKNTIIEELKNIYSKRDKKEPYIKYERYSR